MTEERVEHLLAEVHDEFGMIRVLEVADYRFLEFGDAIEQSCVFTADPSWLEYDYTRAMLIGALCHEHPESALFLGLGAGTLTQACLKFLPLEDVESSNCALTLIVPVLVSTSLSSASSAPVASRDFLLRS